MNITRAVNKVARSVCLPSIRGKYQPVYFYVWSHRANKNIRKFWYADHYVDMPAKIEEIVALMDGRERFKGLREFVDRLLDVNEPDDFRMRFLINAQTFDDTFLAMVYINYRLKEARPLFFNGSSTYRLHTDWLKANNRPAVDLSDDDDPLTAHLKPIWNYAFYPMYIEAEMPDYNELLANDELLDKFHLIYALESRNTGFGPGGFMFNMPFFGFFGPSKEELEAEAQQSLLRAGFKTVYIPDIGNDELVDVFIKIAAGLKMSVAKNLKFNLLRKEYGKYLNTEQDVLAIARILKENKIINGSLDKPIAYKDIASIFEAESDARKLYSAAARGSKADNPWGELNNLIGVEQIKIETRKIVDCMLLDKRRRELGLPSSQLTTHSVFFGSPGTSKTTVARIIAKILQYEGLIRTDAFRELKKSDVVGAHAGWTAGNVDGIFTSMSNVGGGVLLFDEAYTYTCSLDTPDYSSAFDKEAVNCIVQNMENHREVMCIFAGYKEPMQDFVESNPGLRSRIGFVLEFSDYSASSMCRIVEYHAKLHGYKLPDNCAGMFEDYFAELKRLQGDGWGNGREARKLLENATVELASRLASKKRKPSKSQVTVLNSQDITNAIDNSLRREKAFESKRIKKIGYM